MSDFYFGSERNITLQFSRKQAGELLGDIDEAERQIQKYYDKADENYQIIEGIVSPVPMFRKKSDRMVLPPHHGRVMYSYSVTDTGYITNEHQWNVGAELYWAWLHSLDRCGVTTYNTINWQDTVRLLIAIYRNESKPPEDHSTLKRVIKPRIQIPTHDKFVQSIMYVSWLYKVGVGEKKANALKDAGFSSLLDLAMAEVHEVCAAAGIGKTQAVKLLSAIGRQIDG